jgi:hypothetical protein
MTLALLDLADLSRSSAGVGRDRALASFAALLGPLQVSAALACDALHLGWFDHRLFDGRWIHCVIPPPYEAFLPYQVA